ncbi:hypothetical protein WJX81_003782 [Elliptochloris bilobata]|uniref:FAD synthase n=1 Tax=Elliptochloris bilobata TaxID=381761 RepID=A0AAW1S5E9_9CHLO
MPDKRPRARARSTCRCACGTSEQSVEECTLDDWRVPLQGDGRNGCVVALGKFDALHKGHMSLAVRAAELGGAPWLLSFNGMAEVLGWPPRAPLVAECDRGRVLRSWARACGGREPQLRLVPFAAVRGLQPDEFVRVLAEDLQVAGVVVGEGYRFGYRASGDTAALQALGAAAGLRVVVAGLVDANMPGLDGKASSSRVREALAAGRLQQVAGYLGRRYRLVAVAEPGATVLRAPDAFWLSSQTFRNQPPQQHKYTAEVFVEALPDAPAPLPDTPPQPAWQGSDVYLQPNLGAALAPDLALHSGWRSAHVEFRQDGMEVRLLDGNQMPAELLAGRCRVCVEL